MSDSWAEEPDAPDNGNTAVAGAGPAVADKHIVVAREVAGMRMWAAGDSPAGEEHDRRKSAAEVDNSWTGIVAAAERRSDQSYSLSIPTCRVRGGGRWNGEGEVQRSREATRDGRKLS